MAIVRWLDPFRDLSLIQDRMNQIFEDALSRSRGREEGLRSGMWMPDSLLLICLGMDMHAFRRAMQSGCTGKH